MPCAGTPRNMEHVENVKEKAAQLGDSMKGKAAQLGHSLKGTASRLGHCLQGAAAHLGDGVRGTAVQLGDGAKSAAAQARDKVQELGRGIEQACKTKFDDEAELHKYLEGVNAGYGDKYAQKLWASADITHLRELAVTSVEHLVQLGISNPAHATIIKERARTDIGALLSPACMQHQLLCMPIMLQLREHPLLHAAHGIAGMHARMHNKR